jgi:predicted metal-binding membrane protein
MRRTGDQMETRYQAESAEHPPARDRLRRISPGILLIAVAALCWAITARRMQGMDMGPGTDLGGLGWFAVVWATMMAAMMLPSLVPMGLTYAGASRRAGASSPTAATSAFACAYLLTWLGAGVLAYAAIQGVRSLDLSWLAWHEGGPYVAGGVILASAAYELTPAKSTCLRNCRNPELLTRRWRPGLPGALLMGLEHGGFCVGSSWALMAALFALGVMNVAWMIVVAALVAIEKLLPWDGVAIRATAVFIAALGLAVAFAPDQVPGLTIPG